MTTTEAREALTDIGLALSERLTAIASELYELRERRNAFHEAWTACDYRALYNMGALSRHELETYQAACAVIESNE